MTELDPDTLKKILQELQAVFKKYDLTGGQTISILALHQHLIERKSIELAGLE